MDGKRVLVSGAGGFIGRWSVPALRRLGYEVHAVLSGNTSRDVPEQLRGAKIHFTDLLDDSAIDVLTREVRPSHLLHFAWIATPGVYWNSEENFRWLAASEYLLRSFGAQGGSRVMMAGSCAEYDWSRVEVCDELLSPLANTEAAIPHDDAAAVVSRYAACKIALQATLADFGRREGLSTAWGPIFFQFGPHEHPDRLVPSVICNLLLNREAPCSHGRQVRSFLHVADVGEAFAAGLDSCIQGPGAPGSDDRPAPAGLTAPIGRRTRPPPAPRPPPPPPPPPPPTQPRPDHHPSP